MCMWVSAYRIIIKLFFYQATEIIIVISSDLWFEFLNSDGTYCHLFNKFFFHGDSENCWYLKIGEVRLCQWLIYWFTCANTNDWFSFRQLSFQRNIQIYIILYIFFY